MFLKVQFLTRQRISGVLYPFAVVVSRWNVEKFCPLFFYNNSRPRWDVRRMKRNHRTRAFAYA